MTKEKLCYSIPLVKKLTSTEWLCKSSVIKLKTYYLCCTTYLPTYPTSDAVVCKMEAQLEYYMHTHCIHGFFARLAVGAY